MKGMYCKLKGILKGKFLSKIKDTPTTYLIDFLSKDFDRIGSRLLIVDISAQV